MCCCSPSSLPVSCQYRTTGRSVKKNQNMFHSYGVCLENKCEIRETNLDSNPNGPLMALEFLNRSANKNIFHFSMAKSKKKFWFLKQRSFPIRPNTCFGNCDAIWFDEFNNRICERKYRRSKWNICNVVALNA